LLYRERAVWMPFMNKDAIQEKTLGILNTLKPAKDAGIADTVKALAMYSAGMAVWEMAGLSTIPVETAAGMVFGFRYAAAASWIGKLAGAMTAFAAGRTVLASHITSHKAFSENTVFQLLNATSSTDGAHTHPPLLTSFFMKFSCFPELVKNLGCSLIPVIKPWMFLLVTAVHGGAFTLIWTWLGVDTAARMQNAALAVNRQLHTALVLTMFTGGVLTPLVMAWWIRDLKRGADEAAAVKNQKERRFRLNKIMVTTAPRIRLPHPRRPIQQDTVPETAPRPESSPVTVTLAHWVTRTQERIQKSSLAEMWIVGFLCVLLLSGNDDLM
jgi:uncharacterized membrane protein YdjX (TVP38/TMEM64 family)